MSMRNSSEFFAQLLAGLTAIVVGIILVDGLALGFKVASIGFGIFYAAFGLGLFPIGRDEGERWGFDPASEEVERRESPLVVSVCPQGWQTQESAMDIPSPTEEPPLLGEHQTAREQLPANVDQVAALFLRAQALAEKISEVHPLVPFEITHKITWLAMMETLKDERADFSEIAPAPPVTRRCKVT